MKFHIDLVIITGEQSVYEEFPEQSVADSPVFSISVKRTKVLGFSADINLYYQFQDKMGGYAMALNFGITISKGRSNFQLKLEGDFDATSAYELIYAIKKLPEDTVMIYVNTNCLKEIHPSGLDVFNGFMNSFNGQSDRIVFTGHNSTQLYLRNSWGTTKISNFFIKELRCANV